VSSAELFSAASAVVPPMSLSVTSIQLSKKTVNILTSTSPADYSIWLIFQNFHFQSINLFHATSADYPGVMLIFSSQLEDTINHKFYAST